MQTVDEFVEANGGTSFLELPRVAELVEIAHNLEKLWVDASEQESAMRNELHDVADKRWIRKSDYRRLTNEVARLKAELVAKEAQLERRVGIRTATLRDALGKALAELRVERAKRRVA